MMQRLPIFAICCLISFAVSVASSDTPATPVVSAAAAPAGTEKLGVQWIKVTTLGLGVMMAAVARPRGTCPFPTVILLHGSHGFAKEYVELAQDLARGGLLAVAPCWFAGGGGVGMRFITPIRCPDAPPMPDAASPEAMQIVDALILAVSTLPDARSKDVALFGHSRGGGTALNYILKRGKVRAAVLNSTGYPHELAGAISQLTVPILILHGTADGPADGGSEVTSIVKARDFEAAMKRAGKPVEAMYYEGAGHNGIFTSRDQYHDEVQRMIAFLLRNLRK